MVLAGSGRWPLFVQDWGAVRVSTSVRVFLWKMSALPVAFDDWWRRRARRGVRVRFYTWARRPCATPNARVCACPFVLIRAKANKYYVRETSPRTCASQPNDDFGKHASLLDQSQHFGCRPGNQRYTMTKWDALHHPRDDGESGESGLRPVIMNVSYLRISFHFHQWYSCGALSSSPFSKVQPHGDSIFRIQHQPDSKSHLQIVSTD